MMHRAKCCCPVMVPGLVMQWYDPDSQGNYRMKHYLEGLTVNEPAPPSDASEYYVSLLGSLADGSLVGRYNKDLGNNTHAQKLCIIPASKFGQTEAWEYYGDMYSGGVGFYTLQGNTSFSGYFTYKNFIGCVTAHNGLSLVKLHVRTSYSPSVVWNDYDVPALSPSGAPYGFATGTWTIDGVSKIVQTAVVDSMTICQNHHDHVCFTIVFSVRVVTYTWNSQFHYWLQTSDHTYKKTAFYRFENGVFTSLPVHADFDGDNAQAFTFTERSDGCGIAFKSGYTYYFDGSNWSKYTTPGLSDLSIARADRLGRFYAVKTVVTAGPLYSYYMMRWNPDTHTWETDATLLEDLSSNIGWGIGVTVNNNWAFIYMDSGIQIKTALTTNTLDSNGSGIYVITRLF